MWSAITGIFNKLFDSVAKVFPFLIAKQSGRDEKEKEVLENTLEKREETDEAANKTKEEMRDKGVADYVRNNDI